MADKKAEAEPRTGTGEQESTTKREAKTSIKYPPYVNAYNAIPKLFGAIVKASVPPKFTLDFMEAMLEMKSSSHRALIPLLKRLQFIDAANVPTEAYRNYRDAEMRGSVMAAQLRTSYSMLYQASEYAHTLKKEELQAKLRSVLGAAEDDTVVPNVASTFAELAKLADFSASTPPIRKLVAPPVEETDEETSHRKSLGTRTLGLSYTINLNLPATTEIEVFNAIFKSLKENLLDE